MLRGTEGRDGRRFFMSRQRWLNSSHSLPTSRRTDRRSRLANTSFYGFVAVTVCRRRHGGYRLARSVTPKGLKGTHKHNGKGTDQLPAFPYLGDPRFHKQPPLQAPRYPKRSPKRAKANIEETVSNLLSGAHCGVRLVRKKLMAKISPCLAVASIFDIHTIFRFFKPLSLLLLHA